MSLPEKFMSVRNQWELRKFVGYLLNCSHSVIDFERESVGKLCMQADGYARYLIRCCVIRGGESGRYKVLVDVPNDNRFRLHFVGMADRIGEKEMMEMPRAGWFRPKRRPSALKAVYLC